MSNWFGLSLKWIEFCRDSSRDRAVKKLWARLDLALILSGYLLSQSHKYGSSSPFRWQLIFALATAPRNFSCLTDDLGKILRNLKCHLLWKLKNRLNLFFLEQQSKNKQLRSKNLKSNNSNFSLLTPNRIILFHLNFRSL